MFPSLRLIGMPDWRFSESSNHMRNFFGRQFVQEFRIENLGIVLFSFEVKSTPMLDLDDNVKLFVKTYFVN